jgi:hypothetical protein
VTEIPDFMKDLFEAGPASPKEGMKGGSAQAEASSPTSDKDKTAVLLEALQAITSKGDEKPKTKEADSVKVPDFPNPETYRSWKNATREAVRAASDRPDEAFAWIMEVYAKDCKLESLRDTGKFLTLDTKLLASLTKISKGELQRQILNYKESEALQSRAVRGRQVLYMFEQHFKTNEAAGSLYSLEDLLKVTLQGDDLTAFLYNWEGVLAGMDAAHLPDSRTLRYLFLRQLRGSNRMKFDLEAFDRAKEGDTTHSYEFLIQSVRDLLTRERVRKNRERISRTHGAKFGAAAQDEGADDAEASRKGKPNRRNSRSNSNRSRRDGSNPRKTGLCINFQKGTCKNGKNCKYRHEKGSRSPSRSPGRRSPSPKGGKGTAKIPCKFFKIGKCTRDPCRFSHDSPAAPAKEDDNKKKKKDKSRSPSPAAKKGNRGRSSERKTSACCVLATAATREGQPGSTSRGCLKSAHRRPDSWKPKLKVRFSEKVDTKDVPQIGDARRTLRKKRVYIKQWSQTKHCPKPDKSELEHAIDTADMLAKVVEASLSGKDSPCRYDCDDEDLFCPKCMKVVIPEASRKGLPSAAPQGSPAAVAHSPIEFIADTGSEEDLISLDVCNMFFPKVRTKSANQPINLCTANGPAKADKVANLNIPELDAKSQFYTLDDTPTVLSVGKKCLEEGFAFHWPPGEAPYFIKPDGSRLDCRLRGRVPVFGGSTSHAAAALEADNAAAPTSVMVDYDGQGFQKVATRKGKSRQ